MRHVLYSTLQQIDFIAGKKAQPVQILRGVKTHRLLFHMEADVTIVGAAGGNVLAEGLQRLITQLRILENGKPKIDIDGMMLAYITSRAGYQAANIGALANANAQANTILRADFCLDFASVFGADPTETCYVESDSRFPTMIEVTWAASAEAILISGTGLTLNSCTITPVQMYDPDSQVPPFFLPRIYRTTSPAITGAQTGFLLPLYPEAGNRVASVVLHAIDDDLTSTGIITGNVTLRGDSVRYVDQVDFNSVLDESRRIRPGVTPSAGFVELDCRFYGKLSEMFVYGQDDNLRAQVDVSAPGGVNVIDGYRFEMEPIPGYTRDLPPGW